MRKPFNGDYTITQPFGVNPADYARFGMNGHNGIDYGLPSGTLVIAAISGTAQVLSDPPGFGNYVTVTNGQYKTIYAHLDHATVTNGQQVTEGQQIGVSNNTGNSSGPHLHFGVKPVNGLNNNNGFFGAIDPQPILNQGTPTMKPLDLARARVLAFAILGRNGQDGKQNALNGDSDADLNANHVGQDPFDEIWGYFQSAEGQEWVYRRLPGVYQRASDLAVQNQAQMKTIQGLNEQVKQLTAALEAVQATLAPQTPPTTPDDSGNPPVVPDEAKAPSDAEVAAVIRRFAAWLESQSPKAVE
jgi:hypothetical protein